MQFAYCVHNNATLNGGEGEGEGRGRNGNSISKKSVTTIFVQDCSLHCISELFMQGRRRKKGQVSVSLKMWYTTKKGKNWDFPFNMFLINIFLKISNNKHVFPVLALIFVNKRQPFFQHQSFIKQKKTEEIRGIAPLTKNSIEIKDAFFFFKKVLTILR